MEAENCPFCGKKIKITHGLVGVPFLFFKCTNAKCGAIISFDNDITNNNPEKAIDNFNRRADYESTSKELH